jgi:hypothetical protein
MFLGDFGLLDTRLPFFYLVWDISKLGSNGLGLKVHKVQGFGKFRVYA